MVAFRVTAITAIVMSLMVFAAPAGAKVQRTDSPASAADAKTAKPLQLTSRRARAAARAQARAAKVATAKAAKSERSTERARKRMARKLVTRKWASRARHAKVVAAPMAEQEIDEPTENAKVPVPKPRAATAAPRRDRMADGEQTSGFAAIWAERSIGAPEQPAASDGRVQEAQAQPAPAEQVVTSEPAPAAAPRPVRVASQEELNEMDLAAASMAGSSDSVWLRTLFIVFGGLIAAGSALRLFV